MAQTRRARPPPAPKGQMYMLLMMMLMLIIMTTPSLSSALGTGMSFVLNPTIGFDGRLPVISVFFAGALTGVLSTGLRHWSSDYVALERGRLLQKSFQRDLNAARLKRDVDRIERMKRAQPFVMSKTMEANYATMRPAIGTMVVALAVFGWLSVFLSQTVHVSSISLPWASTWPLHASFGFPYWVVLYMVMSLPLTVALSAVLKLWRYRNFDPNAPLKPMPTVEDLIQRADGEAENEDLIAAESDRARKRLKGGRAGAKVSGGSSTTIVDADEDEVEIVDPEADGEDEREAGGDNEGAGATDDSKGDGDEDTNQADDSTRPKATVADAAGKQPPARTKR